MDSSASSSSVQSALSLINNMSHLMSIKLDSTNYMIWKLQISAILDAYSMIEHLDGTIAQPRQFLISEAGVQSVNSEFLAWKKRDKALLTLIYSTLSPPVLAMVVGKGTSQEVWETLEERFTCTARANVLNLKLELQAIRKGNESPNTGFNGHPSYGNPSSNRGRGRNSFQRGRGGRFHNFTPSQPPYQQQHQNQAPYQQQNQNQASPQARSERPICQICWKQGHYAIDCYHRMDFAYQGKNPTMKLAAMASASDHITANANNLSPQVPYQGQEQVSVGNGQNLPIQNIACTAHSSSDKWQLWHSRLGHPSAKFQAMVHTQFSLPIKTIRTDCGGEFTSNQFNQFCASKGMIHQVSCPHTPQQNGVAERKHRHLVQCALALLSQSTLPMSYWSYAISTAIHLINKLPTPNLSNKSPWETLYHTLPDFTYLKTFGCQCFPLLTPYTAHKLYPKTAPCIFLGYPTHSKGYYCLDPTNLRLYVSRHVLFNESTFPGLKHSTDQHSASPQSAEKCPQPSSTSAVQNTLASTSPSPLPPVNTTDPTIPTSATITNPTPPLQHHMQTRSKHGIFKPKVSYAAHIDYTTTEPTSYTNASKHSQWCTAMDEEFQALQQQGTWSLVPLPATKNVVGCKWVYKLKHNSDGSIARYKARLVAKGFHQQQGIDFDETFSPVIKPPTVRLILSLAVSLHWPLRQLDVKNAFLHGTLKEEVYMTQPQGYIDPTHPNLVCKLHKSIYGLKQAPRTWFDSFTSQLLHLGFTASTADSSLFIYKNESVIAYLLLYVDDIVLTSNTPTYLDHLITQLNTVFDLKDLGTLHYFLGLQVSRTPNNLYIKQTKYAYDLLKKHNMLDCKPASSPSCPNTRLSLHDGDPLTDPHGYRSMVGALHYLTFTRPDISFAVHQVCQYMLAPTTTHLAAAKRVLRYIRGTLHHGIEFTPWSSTESEYRALAFASAELCWIRTLLKDLGIFISATPILWCDNVSALAIASNPVFHARTKHIEVDFHFVRERVLRKDLLVKFVSTVDQLADIFTKSLPTNRFLDLRRNLIVPVLKLEGG
uniref:Integrase catalytic domain-containing protein n=1 Tax=Fagus sylvatica TaxID=28930 RepID=A0A2N9IQM4_FAGSY